MTTKSEPKVADLIGQARDLLLQAEKTEGCPWCRSHISSVRMLCDDLQALAHFSDDLRESPEMRKLLVTVTKLGEQWGVLTFLAHVFHRLRRFGKRLVALEPSDGVVLW